MYCAFLFVVIRCTDATYRPWLADDSQSGWRHMMALAGMSTANFSRTTSCRPPARGFQDPSLRDRTSGFELTKIEEETPTKVTDLLQERNSDGFSRLTLEVEAAEPYRILKLAMPQVERPAEFALPHLSDDQLVVALRKKVQEETANDRFAGAVLIAKDRKAIFGRAYRIRIRRVAPGPHLRQSGCHAAGRVTA